MKTIESRNFGGSIRVPMPYLHRNDYLLQSRISFELRYQSKCSQLIDKWRLGYHRLASQPAATNHSRWRKEGILAPVPKTSCRSAHICYILEPTALLCWDWHLLFCQGRQEWGCSFWFQGIGQCHWTCRCRWRCLHNSCPCLGSFPDMFHSQY